MHHQMHLPAATYLYCFLRSFRNNLMHLLRYGPAQAAFPVPSNTNPEGLPNPCSPSTFSWDGRVWPEAGAVNRLDRSSS